jgi:hypothetical protein
MPQPDQTPTTSEAHAALIEARKALDEAERRHREVTHAGLDQREAWAAVEAARETLTAATKRHREALHLEHVARALARRS